MLSRELKKFNIDPDSVLSDPLNKQVLETLSRFSEKIRSLGYDVPVSSRASLIKLMETPAEKKLQIAESYEQWLSWIDPEEDGSGVPPERTEKAFLQRALQHYGFHVDDEFWATFDEEQFVQIYGEDMIQLYRSLNFFKVCGYSLLDVSVFEWYVLWERPRRIMDDMIRSAREVLEEFIPVKKLEAPRHVLRETYDTGLSDLFVPRASLVDFCYVASLTKSAIRRNPCGLICTTTGHIIATGEEALQIQFV